MVVEDVKEQREALVKMIERNYIDSRIYSTDSVKKALQIATKKDINLFILDIELIDGSGLDLAKELRKMNKYDNKEKDIDISDIFLLRVEVNGILL